MQFIERRDDPEAKSCVSFQKILVQYPRCGGRTDTDKDAWDPPSSSGRDGRVQQMILQRTHNRIAKVPQSLGSVAREFRMREKIEQIRNQASLAEFAHGLDSGLCDFANSYVLDG